MAQTPNYHIPIPEAGDDPDVPDDMGKALAAVDAAIRKVEQGVPAQVTGQLSAYQPRIKYGSSLPAAGNEGDVFLLI